MIYSVKTVVGREDIVLDALATRAKKAGLEIRALVHPEEIKGYIFVEGKLADIERAVRNIPHTRGMIRKPIELADIQRFLQPREVVIELSRGDIVEVIGGPFKGERGKVTQYDKARREVIIELLEVVVPIPITISVEFVKLVKKKET
jgi:transcriptional antiterminator NusG